MKSPNIKSEIMWRVKLLYFVFALVGLVIFGRILLLQFGPGGTTLRQKAEERTFRPVMIDGKRGEIFAEDGSLLATSVRMYHLGMDFGVDSLTQKRFTSNVDALSDSLASCFGGRTKEGFKTLLTQGWENRKRRRYRRLVPRLITSDELKRVQTFPLLREKPGYGGLSIEMVYRREHPFGSLAERTLGNTRSVYDTIVVPHRDSTKRRVETMLTERGLYGIEYSFNDHLKGRHGWQMMQKQTDRFSTPVDSPLNIDPANGLDIVTTLDMDFQDVASTMLARQLVKHNAERGTVVLMEVATGEIKAIANLDNVNGRCYERLNHALGGVDEPGSTFKLATLLALLDDGMRLDEKVYIGDGKMELRGAHFRDDHKPETPYVSLKRVFETSSNVGFVRAVESRFKEPGREAAFIDYLAGLGFDRPIGTRMTGEAVPVFHRPTDNRRYGEWNNNSLAYISHGYGIEVSTLHTLALYNAVAGGGKMVRPMLIKELSKEGKTLESFDTEVINPSIASESAIRDVRAALEGVVDEGTGGVLKNPYYKVAAKTGTAQQLTRGRYRREQVGQVYLATMAGYFPADNPAYTCVVSIWTKYGSPGDIIYGSGLAGPVFKAIADRVYVTRYDLQKPVAVVK